MELGMMKSFRWGSMSLAILLVACGSTKVFETASPPGGDKALVYFIRHSYPPYIHAVRLVVNGKELATISNNDYVAVNVPVGKNAVLVDVTDGKPLSFDMPVDRAEKIYVVLTGDVTKSGQSAIRNNTFTIDLSWNLRAFPVARAEAETIVSEFGRKLD
jgi:hypothetical protein